MKKLILIGGGGHCVSCIDVIELEGAYKIVGILDTADKVGNNVLGYEIIGTDEDITQYIKAGYSFLITLGQIKSAQLRKKLYNKLLKNNAKIATILSPRAYISKHTTIESGSIIMHDALINAGVQIQENCIINTKAIIEHQTTIEAHCHISTGAIINGNVTVKEGTFFGSNSVSKESVVTQTGDFIKAGTCYSGTDRKEKKIAFLTTLFPVCESYLHDFLQSLTKQTWKKFDLIILNDGFNDFQLFKKKYSNLNIIELPSANNIAKNREALIKYSRANNYDIAIFGDIDDYFSENRIEVVSNLLNENDIVVNDLTTIMNNKTITKNILSKRLKNNDVIPLDFVLDKNIFGFTNTAINLEILKSLDIYFDDKLLAVDWYFYTTLLLLNKKAIFTNEVNTYYRQHTDNIAGLGNINKETILKLIKIKEQHYRLLSKQNDHFKALLINNLKLSEQVQNKKKLKEIERHNTTLVSPLLWWEINSNF